MKKTGSFNAQNGNNKLTRCVRGHKIYKQNKRQNQTRQIEQQS